MNCSKCGAKLGPTDKFCLSCGAPVNAPVQQPAPQPMGNPNPAGYPQTPKPAGNNTVVAIVGIIAVTAIVIALLFIFLGNDDKKTETKKDNDTPVVDDGNTDTPNVDDEDEDEGDDIAISDPVYTVDIGNFTYSIPTGYRYQYDEEYVALQNSDYYIEVAAQEGMTFSVVDEAIAQEVIAELGGTYGSSEAKTVNGRSYYVTRFTYSGIECVYVFDKSAYNYAAVGFGYSLDGTYDAAIVDEIISILEDVKYNTSSNLNTTKIELDHSKAFK